MNVCTEGKKEKKAIRFARVEFLYLFKLNSQHPFCVCDWRFWCACFAYTAGNEATGERKRDKQRKACRKRLAPALYEKSHSHTNDDGSSPFSTIKSWTFICDEKHKFHSCCCCCCCFYCDFIQIYYCYLNTKCSRHNLLRRCSATEQIKWLKCGNANAIRPSH